MDRKGPAFNTPLLIGVPYYPSSRQYTSLEAVMVRQPIGLPPLLFSRVSPFEMMIIRYAFNPCMSGWQSLSLSRIS